MRVFVALFALVAISHVSAGPVISPTLSQALRTNEVADIMIIMKSSTSQVLSQVESRRILDIDAKASALYEELNKFTSSSQKEVLSILTRFKSAKVKSFYIANRISVKGASKELIESLLSRDDIKEIREEKIIQLEKSIETGLETMALEWGVNQINSPLAWARGFTGQGVVVSNIDTGVRYTHQDLVSGYRADHGWFDPYQGTATPNDQNGHGTHTMGSITGKNGTGVAPDATWIACKGCSTSSCTEAALIGCGEWTFCPTDASGGNRNCSLRPDISSNSWGGGREDSFYDEVVNTWNSVNILPIFAIGNGGPGCRTANSPGDRPNVISVGATNNADNVASFSSHGPSLSALRIKPEVSAPGVNIRSCGIGSDAAYSISSGTSMATPHVAGAAALLLQSGLTNRTEVATALQDTTFRKPLNSVICSGGGVNPDDPWPNNSYGWGRIDIAAALGINGTIAAH